MRRFFVGILFLASPGWATPEPSLFSYNAKATQTKYHRPEDILPRIPILNLIPKTFLFSGGYTVDLSIKEMRIDHMTKDSKSPRQNRSCLIAFSYLQPVGDGLFSSRFDVPLLSASHINARWGAASVGDYVIFLSNTPAYSSAMKLLASARF